MDLSRAAERGQLMTLLASADVLVENFKTGSMEKWGLGYETLHERFPRLVHCRVSGFGADGPLGGLPGYDAAILALAGLMSVNGEAGGESLRVGLPVVDMVTGLNAALGIMFALNERARSGLGQFVEASLYDCGLSLLHPHAANWLLDGRTPTRSGNAHPNIYPYDTFATGTDPIFLAVGNDAQFANLCSLIGASELSTDPRFATNGQRSVNRPALKVLLENSLRTHDCTGLADKLMRAGDQDEPHPGNLPACAARPKESRWTVRAHFMSVRSPRHLQSPPPCRAWSDSGPSLVRREFRYGMRRGAAEFSMIFTSRGTA